jgi:hypothetical protein
MIDGVLEEKVREIMNVHLYPDIVLKLLKFFTRNLMTADTISIWPTLSTRRNHKGHL